MSSSHYNNRNEIEFKFRKELYSRYEKCSRYLIPKEIYNQMFNAISKNPNGHSLSSKYEVITSCYVERIVKKRKNHPESDAPIKYYVSIEDTFDIIERAHLATGHGSRYKMIKELVGKYANISGSTVDLFISLCQECQHHCHPQQPQDQKKKRKNLKRKLESLVEKEKEDEEKEEMVKKTTFQQQQQQPLPSPSLLPFSSLPTPNNNCSKFASVGEVSLFDIIGPYCTYNYIMMYRDKHTNFCILRQLKFKSAIEIIPQLVEILLLVGAPMYLEFKKEYSKFQDEIIAELRALELKIFYAFHSIESTNKGGEIESRIKKWKNDNPSSSISSTIKNWDLGINYVQFDMNSTYHPEIKKSPYEAMFGVVARNVNSKLPPILSKPIEPKTTTTTTTTTLPNKNNDQPIITRAFSEGNKEVINQQQCHNNNNDDGNNKFASTGQVSIIKILTPISNGLSIFSTCQQYVIMYRDKNTKFCVLRSLMFNATEIIRELIKIILLLGVPMKLEFKNESCEFHDEITTALHVLYPKLDFSFDYNESTNGDEIKDMMKGWSIDNTPYYALPATKSWLKGINCVQFDMNSVYHPEIKKSPYEATFGVIARNINCKPPPIKNKKKDNDHQPTISSSTLPQLNWNNSLFSKENKQLNWNNSLFSKENKRGLLLFPGLGYCS